MGLNRESERCPGSLHGLANQLRTAKRSFSISRKTTRESSTARAHGWGALQGLIHVKPACASARHVAKSSAGDLGPEAGGLGNTDKVRLGRCPFAATAPEKANLTAC
jgi:hypothetical protein